MAVKSRICAAAVSALLFCGPAMAGAPPADQCAALNYLLAQARTDFPALSDTKFSGGSCSMARQQFKCRWGFPGDRFTAAKTQGERLADCTAAQPGAKPLGEKRGEVGYQVNPETSVYLRGPTMDSGEWALMLRIVTTADWK
jgi:hypothetical protein